MISLQKHLQYFENLSSLFLKLLAEVIIILLGRTEPNNSMIISIIYALCVPIYNDKIKIIKVPFY